MIQNINQSINEKGQLPAIGSQIISEPSTSEEVAKAVRDMKFGLLAAHSSDDSSESFEIRNPRGLLTWQFVDFGTPIEVSSNDTFSSLLNKGLTYYALAIRRKAEPEASADPSSIIGPDVQTSFSIMGEDSFDDSSALASLFGAALSPRNLTALINSARGGGHNINRFVLVKDTDVEWMRRMELPEFASTYGIPDDDMGNAFRKLLSLQILSVLGFVERTANLSFAFSVTKKYASINDLIRFASMKETIGSFIQEYETAFQKIQEWIQTRALVKTNEVAARMSLLQDINSITLRLVDRQAVGVEHLTHHVHVIASFLRFAALRLLVPQFASDSAATIGVIVKEAAKWYDVVSLAYSSSLVVSPADMESLKASYAAWTGACSLVNDRLVPITIAERMRHVDFTFLRSERGTINGLILTSKVRYEEHSNFFAQAEEDYTAYVPVVSEQWLTSKKVTDALDSSLIMDLSKGMIMYFITLINNDNIFEVYVDMRMDLTESEPSLAILGLLAAESLRADRFGTGKLYYLCRSAHNSDVTQLILASYNHAGASIKYDEDTSSILTDSWQLVIDLSRYVHQSDVLSIKTPTIVTSALGSTPELHIFPAQKMLPAIRKPKEITLNGDLRLKVPGRSFLNEAGMKNASVKVYFHVAPEILAFYSSAGSVLTNVNEMMKNVFPKLEHMPKLIETAASASYTSEAISKANAVIEGMLDFIKSLPFMNRRTTLAFGAMVTLYPEVFSFIPKKQEDANKQLLLANYWFIASSFLPKEMNVAVLGVLNLMTGLKSARFKSKELQSYYSFIKNLPGLAEQLGGPDELK